MSFLDVAYEAARSAASGACHEAEDAFRAYEGVFQRKYRHWRGRTGRTYVFSVYAAQECPAYEDAVLLVVGPERERLVCVDLGPFPEARLSRLRQRFAAAPGLQFHIHVLAEREADRRAVIEDLSPHFD